MLSLPTSRLFPLAVLCAAAHAQVWETEPLTIASVSPGAGFVVDSVGDLDGDGLRDALISDLAHSNGRGRAFAVSTATGATLLSFGGQSPGDAFGHSLAGVGDVDGDGVADIAVGAPAIGPGRPGYVAMHSGATGAQLWTANGQRNGDQFGFVVARVGDVTGDGIDDVGVCAPGYDTVNFSGAGRVYIYSGADGTRVRFWNGNSANAFFGASCGPAGDANGDGVEDMVACATGGGANGRGEAVVLSGADGAEIWRVDAGGGCLQYGAYFSGAAGDVNADGVEDVYVIDYQNVAQRGRLFVYSGSDGTRLHSIRGPQGARWVFGRVRMGDLDGDGHDDLALCSGQNNDGGSGAGAVYYFSGATGASLGQYTGSDANRAMGTDSVSVGDIDGDGTEDLFVGVGSVDATMGGGYVLPSRPGPPITYCEGVPNSTGAAGAIDYRGSLDLNIGGLTLDLAGLPGDSLAIVFGGPSEDLTPIGDGLRCVANPAARIGQVTANGAGTAQLLPTLPASGPAAVLAGLSWHVQGWYRDAAAGGTGFNLTSALRMTFR